MFPSSSSILGLWASAVLLTVPCVSAATPTVELQSVTATIIGSQVSGIDSFRGIPYAQPPVGDLRLRAPTAVTNSLGTITDTAKPRACPQFLFDTTSFPQNLIGYLLDSPLFQTISNAGEDCLTINVQRPSTRGSGLLPVLVWIYGGAYSSGSTQDYDGTSIIQTSVDMGNPILFVSMNYRLGGFGFLPGQEAMDASASNLGLLDQRLALKWVSDNIVQFGGDPDKVTIWGQSAGAGSVFSHLTLYDGDNSYGTKKLFHGAIMNSGSMSPAQSANAARPQNLYNQIVKSGGCASAVDTFECLRGLSYVNLLNAANSVPSLFGYSTELSYRPRPDGVTLTDSPEELIKAGKYADVPLIVGDEEDEGTLPSLFQWNISNTDALTSYLQDTVFDQASQETLAELVAAYPDDPAQGCPFRTENSNILYAGYKRLAAIMGDTHQTQMRRAFLEMISPDISTWSFFSTIAHSTPFIGTAHSSEIPYVFGQSSGNPKETFQRYYISFVNYLDPNAGNTSLAAWPPYSKSQQSLSIGSESNTLITDNFRDEGYAVIKKSLSELRL